MVSQILVLLWLYAYQFAAGVLDFLVAHEKTLPPFPQKQLEVLKGDPAVSHLVTLEISQESKNGKEKKVGKLVLAMFGDVVPRTVNNFLQLSLSSPGFGYKGTAFHRIIENFMVQGGNHASGGKSIYEGGRFDDENFVLKHNKQGRLSMANAGPNTNGGQFFIVTAKETPHLDGKHVVFGQLIDGFETLQLMNTVKTEKDKPVLKIYIKDASVIATGQGSQKPVLLPEGTSPQKVLLTLLGTQKNTLDQRVVSLTQYMVLGVVVVLVIAVVVRVSRTPGLRK